MGNSEGPAGSNPGLERPGGHVLHSDGEPAACINISQPRRPCLYPYINSCYSLLQPHKRHGEKWTHVPLAAELGSCGGGKGCSSGSGILQSCFGCLSPPSPCPPPPNPTGAEGSDCLALFSVFSFWVVYLLISLLFTVTLKICFYPRDGDGGNR